MVFFKKEIPTTIFRHDKMLLSFIYMVYWLDRLFVIVWLCLYRLSFNVEVVESFIFDMWGYIREQKCSLYQYPINKIKRCCVLKYCPKSNWKLGVESLRENILTLESDLLLKSHQGGRSGSEQEHGRTYTNHLQKIWSKKTQAIKRYVQN